MAIFSFVILHLIISIIGKGDNITFLSYFIQKIQ